MLLFQKIARGFPELKLKLRQAGMYQEPEDYIKNAFMSSTFLSVGIALFLLLLSRSLWALLVLPILFPIVFIYFIKYVDMKIEKIKKKIDEEIIFAGRFLIIGLEAGVPIHKIFEQMEKNYEHMGFYFGEILTKVYLGTSIEDAINEAIIASPSPNLRRILWQVLNSMKTGTEIGPSLNSVIDQIVREQDIAIKDYGKKLNPMAMFYMMVAIIIPSLGITMLVILVSFVGLKITMPYLLGIALFVGLIQFMFLSIIQTSRPSIST